MYSQNKNYNKQTKIRLYSCKKLGQQSIKISKPHNSAS